MIFLYYIPGTTEKTAKDSPAFASGGLQIVFRDCLDNLSYSESKGPDGGTGLLLYAIPVSREKPFGLRYRPDAQTWIDCGSHWLGMQSNQLPEPEGLRRVKMLDSYRYALADGREWMCPKIRRGGMPLLPAWWKMSKGQFTLEVKTEFVDIWNESESWSLDIRSISYTEAFSICALCLGLNYRIGVNEISMLNMLDAATSRDVILAALDEQFFVDMLSQKKTEEISAESEN